MDKNINLVEILKDCPKGTTENGKPCFTIVEHSDLYEAFDF